MMKLIYLILLLCIYLAHSTQMNMHSGKGGRKGISLSIHYGMNMLCAYEDTHHHPVLQLKKKKKVQKLKKIRIKKMKERSQPYISKNEKYKVNLKTRGKKIGKRAHTRTSAHPCHCFSKSGRTKYPERDFFSHLHAFLKKSKKWNHKL